MTGSDQTIWIVIGAIVLVAIIAMAIVGVQRNRSAALRKKFGPEYDRTVKETGSRAQAESELAQREKRVKRMHIEELPAGARTRYTEEWRTVQQRFVDEPKGALLNADKLVTSVMRDRGYPTADFDQNVADLSPDHPQVLNNYRAAHGIVERVETGQASTEEMRQAIVYYRSLFDDLLGK